eukprot:scaffold3556_cov67-Attheya_sp.AAC.5
MEMQYCPLRHGNRNGRTLPKFLTYDVNSLCRVRKSRLDQIDLMYIPDERYIPCQCHSHPVWVDLTHPSYASIHTQPLVDFEPMSAAAAQP